MKYDSSDWGQKQSNNYHGLGWRAANEWSSGSMIPTPNCKNLNSGSGSGTQIPKLIESGRFTEQEAKVMFGYVPPMTGRMIPTPTMQGLNGGASARVAARELGLPETMGDVAVRRRHQTFRAPVADDAADRNTRKPGQTLKLSAQVKMLPTPTSAEATRGAVRHGGGKYPSLQAVALDGRTQFPTPTTGGLEGGASERRRLRELGLPLRAGSYVKRGGTFPTPTATVATATTAGEHRHGSGTLNLMGEVRRRLLPTVLKQDSHATWKNPGAHKAGNATIMAAVKEEATGERVARSGTNYAQPTIAEAVGIFDSTTDLTLASSGSLPQDTSSPETSTEQSFPDGGKLNPTWVEWLMDWTPGWTALQPLETDKWRLWLSLHGITSADE